MTNEVKLDWLARLRSDLKIINLPRFRIQYHYVLTEVINDLNRPKKKWIKRDLVDYETPFKKIRVYVCPECAFSIKEENNEIWNFNFCPKCGEDLRGGEYD